MDIIDKQFQYKVLDFVSMTLFNEILLVIKKTNLKVIEVKYGDYNLFLYINKIKIIKGNNDKYICVQ